MSKVLGVLINWKRPENIPALIKAWRPQVNQLVVVNNADGLTLAATLLESGITQKDFDDCWSWTKNSGPPCRWAPALIDGYNYDYVLFADDDFIPVDDAVSKMLNRARSMDNAFATIGTDGRDFFQGLTYKYGTSPAVPDITVRMHLVRTDLMWIPLWFRTQIISRWNTEETRRLCSVHDDMLLCLGIRFKTGFPCSLVRGLIKQNLDQVAHSIHHRPNHMAERQWWVDRWNELRGAPRAADKY